MPGTNRPTSQSSSPGTTVRGAAQHAARSLRRRGSDERIETELFAGPLRLASRASSRLAFPGINFGVMTESPQTVTAVSAKFPVAIDTSQRRMGIGQSTVIRKPRVRDAQLTATFNRLWLFYRPGMASRMSVQSRAALRCNRGRRGNDAQDPPSQHLFSVVATASPLRNLWRSSASSTSRFTTPATSARNAVRHAARSPRRRGEPVPELPMRYHLLAPDVRCPKCGAGLTFVRVRRFADLYSCSSGDRCRCQVLHYRSKTTGACGYSTLSASGTFGVWTACDAAAAKGE